MGAMTVPKMYPIAEAAALLYVSEDYLRARLRDRTFAGVKLAGRWRMTEDQIRAAIEAASTTARPAETPSPSGLSKRSRYRRHIGR